MTDEIFIKSNKAYKFQYFERVAATGDVPIIVALDNYTKEVVQSSNYIYLVPSRYIPISAVYNAGEIPYVGGNSGSVFVFYWAKLINNTTGIIENRTQGRAGGNTRPFGSTYVVPSGYTVEVNAITVARRTGFGTI